MKKLTKKEKYYLKLDAESAWKDAIILAYDRNIKYDYPIPEKYTICKAVQAVIDYIGVPKTFRTKVWDLVSSGRDSYSYLESYISNYESRFGDEFFYGYGSLYRWREGEREKAEKRVKTHITTRDQNYFKKLQEAITIDEQIPAFGTDKKLGVY